MERCSGGSGDDSPIAFALVQASGFSPARLFLCWGLVYVATGAYYRVPVSVQPLKAMAVIAITTGVSASLLSTTAVFYGLLLLVLMGTGLIRWLSEWFSSGIVWGVQLGIGFLLAEKALGLIGDHSVYLGSPMGSTATVVALTLGVLGLVAMGLRYRYPVALVCILSGLLGAFVLGVGGPAPTSGGALVNLSLPDWTQLGNVLTLLIIPQLPLTLGNAVYAASDACQRFWPTRSSRTTPSRLATSIGGSNVFIGLLGGFPICHGAGGIAAHERLGGRTGGTTILLGGALLLLALLPGASRLLFLIPVPILGALLLCDSWAMIAVLRESDELPQVIVAGTVAVLGWATHHLTIAVGVGLVVERLVGWSAVRYRLLRAQRFAAQQSGVSLFGGRR